MLGWFLHNSHCDSSVCRMYLSAEVHVPVYGQAVLRELMSHPNVEEREREEEKMEGKTGRDSEKNMQAG